MNTLEEKSSGKRTRSSAANLRIVKIRKGLQALPDKRILGDLKRLGCRERELQATILLYLSEIDRRKLYLPLGYGSLFDLCTSSLGYTRATAARRIASARAAARFPLALDLLLEGEINITTLSIASRILGEDNHSEVLSAIKGKSTREVDMLVSSRSPVPMPRETVKPVCVMRRAPEPAVHEETVRRDGSDPAAKYGSQRDRGEGEAAETRDRPDSTLSAGTRNRPDSTLSDGTGLGRVVLERRLRISFTVDPGFMEKLERIRSLLSGSHPSGMSFEELFDSLIEEYLDRHAPERRNARRRSRALSKGSVRAGSEDRDKGRPGGRSGTSEVRGGLERPGKRSMSGAVPGPAPGQLKRPAPGASPCSVSGKAPAACGSTGISSPGSRHIPASVRDRVYERDGGRCAYIGQDGRRCGSTWDLEIDHIVPKALGGDDSPPNLRLLCRRHNMLEARRRLGPELMAGRIAERRKESAAAG